MATTGSTGAPVALGEGDAYAVSDNSGFRTPLDIAGHPAIADEPVARGGTDAGPSPYGMLSAALAACTAMTLHAYAKLKGLPVTAIRVLVRHEKVHEIDCERCETDAGAKVDRLERTLWIDGTLDDGARARLLQIAERCPVHRTLQGSVRIVTRVG
ncbi:OsmC family protein [Dokdonella fugitiva]|uniref:Putative OsmC-like protein n=1 Tax=Dokdonella fugitiva TaxID=328517 RepID=A0A4R2I9I9_9GAMM|nr:OsmC family protein [Dokdonella fugitiva]MBA8883425.1 putative redox protein [Dokdonella fugitiva]TCO40742.1 putative OsmC-like protein [Dokdonella fugitiva]